MRALIVVLLVALLTALAAAPAFAKSKSGKTKSAPPKTVIVVTKKYHGTRGYGFLPGYRPPQAARRDSFGKSPWIYDATWPWYGGPGFHRGRWNGGGFGPCYTKTPIDPVWNCG